MTDVPSFETGTSSYIDRQALTKRFEENLEVLLADYGFSIMQFGQSVILQDSRWLRSKIKKLDSKESLAAIMVKFSPDYIVTFGDERRGFFFVDAKASITPVFFRAQIRRITEHYQKDPHLRREDIGEIEREAWLSYNKFYPPNHTAIIIATPYNPKLVLAEWVSNVDCMWCLRKSEPGNPIPWDCDECPVFSTDDQGFGVMVNEFAGGSGTPHTNIHFGSMRPLDEFLKQEYGVQLDEKEYRCTILDYVKQWPLNKPIGRVSWSQFNSAVMELRHSCPWLRCRIRDKFIPCPDEPQGSLF